MRNAEGKCVDVTGIAKSVCNRCAPCRKCKGFTFEVGISLVMYKHILASEDDRVYKIKKQSLR